MKRLTLSLPLALCLVPASFVAAQTVALAPVIISATRTETAMEELPVTVHVLSGEAVRAAPATTLDGALRSIPAFSLFRRSDSLTANPTAQGVSLRGLGPSGASRSLVLLDGVPLNDPFGGWVAWSKVPRDSLARVEVLPGGGATAWGNAALGGVVQMFSEAPMAKTGRIGVVAGDFDTRGLEGDVAQAVGPGTLQLAGRVFTTEGFHIVAPERRRAIDRPAGGRHRWLTAKWRQPVGAHAEVSVTARAFEETRANGTPFQRNHSRENFVAAALTAQPSEAFFWSALAYGQDQSFSSTFSAVNATRSAETPASDQFAVPSTAAGAAWTGNVKHADEARTTFGADVRRVDGETREDATFVNGAFTRRRFAGGLQTMAGAFVLHERSLAPQWRMSIGGRVDRWREADGHRREFDRTSGASLRDDVYADSHGWEFSPSAGLVWRPAETVRVRASAQRAFRRPTLNELYRPFRVGNVITEANAALRTETVTSGEIGAEYRTAPWRLAATLFWNELEDAVGNVTVAQGPGNVPGFGFIPAGGVGRQRLNLDETRVRGAEWSAQWQPRQELTFSLDYLFNDAVVRRASVAPHLAGRRVAQVPRHNAAFSAFWRSPAQWTVAPRVRWIGAQYEDDENRLRLAPAVVADLAVARVFGDVYEVRLMLENVGNTRIETGRSVDGLVNIGLPRMLTAAVRRTW